MTDRDQDATAGQRSSRLYRHFDAAGTLLYVGVSLNAAARLSKDPSRPWASRVAIVTAQTLPSRAEALAAEKVAIQTENPEFNITHTVRLVASRSVAPLFPPEFEASYFEEDGQGLPVLAHVVTDAEGDGVLVTFGYDGEIEFKTDGLTHVQLMPGALVGLADMAETAHDWYEGFRATKAYRRIVKETAR